jgi:lantibiotic modifying enzyme
LVEGGPAADRERLIAASCAIADRLAETALHGNGEINWIGLTPVREEKWSLQPLGADLYDGLPGVALFLGYLGAVTGQERHTALARGALSSLRLAIHANSGRNSVRSIGAFTGWGGIATPLPTWERCGVTPRS